MRTQEAAEAWFQAAFEASPSGMAIADEHGRFVRVNAAFEALLKRPAEQIVGHSFEEFTHPEDRAANEEQRRRVGREPGTVADFDKRYVRPDGSIVWVKLGLTAIDGPGGQPYRLVQCEDITARKAADAAARRATARLYETIAAQREILAAVDHQPRMLQLMAERARQILAADYGSVHLLDGDRGDLRLAAGTGSLGTAQGWVIPLAGSLAEQAFAGRAAVRCDDTRTDERTDPQLSARHHVRSLLVAPLITDRTEAGVLVVSARLPGAFSDTDAYHLTLLADALSGALQHAQDTARMEASETRFRLASEHSPLGLTLASIAPGTFGRYLHANPAMTAITGYTVDELTTMTVADLQHPEDAADTYAIMGQLLAGTRDSVHVERRYRHKDGHIVWVALHSAVVRDERGYGDYVVNQVEDVTARRAAERNRAVAAATLAQRNLELEAANQLKLDIIGMLGHEIGNPLSSIRGYSELLTDDWADLDDARRERAVAAIARQAGRLDDIVREVLALAAYDAGTVTADRQALALRPEIARALTAVDNEDLPVTGADTRVWVNAGHLQQILVNLLSNAAKYGAGATAIHIGPAGDRRIGVRVEDRGPGVPEEFRPRLFQRLARAERDASTVSGTGLGLYIVRRLAEANQGSIRYEPGPAGGSLFILELEAADTSAD
ncbi:PAS domain S-box protein [Actinoplanes sp. NPDC049548]|uniref:sensor histidine kinase n=1 Tax=Actinoplanes sp. NPDC049548 TaxID=3155152 RepID=UPI003433713D